MANQVITLEHPFDLDGTTYTEISLRRPKKADLSRFDREKDGSKKTDLILTTLSELPPEVIDQLDIDDLAEIQAAIGGFMKKMSNVAKAMEG